MSREYGISDHITAHFGEGAAVDSLLNNEINDSAPMPNCLCDVLTL